MAGKRVRGKNFTQNDKDILITCVKPHIKVIENSETNKKSNTEKDAVWLDIERKFNSQADSPRDAASLKSFYLQFKMKVKKANAEYKRQQFLTGGGQGPKELDPASVKMLALIANQVEPLHNPFDSGADFHATQDGTEETLDIENIPFFEGDFDEETVGTTFTDQSNSTEVSSNSLVVVPPDSNLMVGPNGSPQNIVGPTAALNSNPIDPVTGSDIDSPSCEVLPNSSTAAVLSAVDTSADAGDVSMTPKTVPTQKRIFPPGNKRKALRSNENQRNLSTKRARMESKTEIEEELISLKRDTFLKQNQLLQIQIETAILAKQAAEIDLKIKQNQFDSTFM